MPSKVMMDNFQGILKAEVPHNKGIYYNKSPQPYFYESMHTLISVYGMPSFTYFPVHIKKWDSFGSKLELEAMHEC